MYDAVRREHSITDRSHSWYMTLLICSVISSNITSLSSLLNGRAQMCHRYVTAESMHVAIVQYINQFNYTQSLSAQTYKQQTVTAKIIFASNSMLAAAILLFSLMQ